MRRILVLTALAAALAVAAIASPAGAGFTPPLTDLTVSPNQGQPGDAFTVSGGGCERIVTEQNGQAAGHSIGGRFAPRGQPAPGPSENFEVEVAVAFPTPTAAVVTPNTAGDWSVGFVVPQGTPPGVYEVSAVCVPVPQNGTPQNNVSFGRARGGPAPTPYLSSTYTVVGDPAAPAAAPVPGTPTFTG